MGIFDRFTNAAQNTMRPMDSLFMPRTPDIAHNQTLFGKEYSPEEAARKRRQDFFLNAGMALMNPERGSSGVGNIGQALAYGVKGMRQGEEQYKEEAKAAHEKMLMDAFIKTAPPELQAVAQSNPELVQKAITEDWLRRSEAKVKAEYDAANPDAVNFGMTPVTIRNKKTGITRPGQLRSDGQPIYDPNTEEYIDPMQTAGGKAEAAEVGKIAGPAKMDLPAAEASANLVMERANRLANDPRLDSVTGWDSKIPTAGMTNDQLAMIQELNALEAEAFKQGYETLKGAGQITEYEGQVAAKAIANFDAARASSNPALMRQSLMEFNNAVQQGMNKIRAKAGAPLVPVTLAPMPPAENIVTPGAEGLPEGWTQEEWDALTPEERAGF